MDALATASIVIRDRVRDDIVAVDVGFAQNIFDLRTAIEAMLTRRAAERIERAQLARLRTFQARFEEHARRLDFVRLLVLNREFHDVINDVAAASLAIAYAAKAKQAIIARMLEREASASRETPRRRPVGTRAARKAAPKPQDRRRPASPRTHA